MFLSDPSRGIPMGYPIPSKTHSRTRKAGASALLASLAIFLFIEHSTGIFRKLCSPDVYFAHTADGPYGVWSELYKSSTVNYYQRAEQAVPEVVPENDVAFVLSMLECPDLAHQGVKEDQPTNEMFYDNMSVLKYSLCTEMDGILHLNNIPHTTSVIALIPGDAMECTGQNGEPYDRVKVLEELNIGVKIVGSPVTRDEVKSQFLRDNVDNDVGIKDLIKLRAFNLTQHSVAVLLDYTTFVPSNLEKSIEDFMTSPAKIAYAEDYTPEGQVPSPNTCGVNTGFVMIKPNEQDFNNLVDTYKNTDFDPSTGWAGSGIVGFPGAMGTSGLLKYYYSQKPANEKPTILDKCHFNNDAEYHLDSNGRCRDGNAICESCQSTPENEIVAAKLNDKVCGKPYDCPDKGLPAGHLCDKLHKKWFERRIDYEDNHLKGVDRKFPRNGNFRKDVTLGFCDAPGETGYGKILPDASSGPLPIPEPEPQPKTGCSNTCSSGMFLTLDCKCTSDACAACPEGTRCQEAKNGVPAMCIDCECGFCDFANNPCCDFNGVNNCKSATNRKECLLQNGFYPGWPGAGNACSGVEISATAVPNGCGCKPNDLTPCTYSPSPNPDDKCFIVNAREILTSSSPAFVASCKTCLDKCNSCVSGTGQKGVTEMMACIGGEIGKKGAGEACRASCANVCRH